MGNRSLRCARTFVAIDGRRRTAYYVDAYHVDHFRTPSEYLKSGPSCTAIRKPATQDFNGSGDAGV
jgi:hypothetical protein